MSKWQSWGLPSGLSRSMACDLSIALHLGDWVIPVVEGHCLEAWALGWGVHEGEYLSVKPIGRPGLLVSSDYSLMYPLPPHPPPNPSVSLFLF